MKKRDKNPENPGRSENNPESRPENQIDALRLMEAVDAAYAAAEEIAQYTGQPRPYPADLMGGPMQPACLAPFTLFEIEEASRFLRRMDQVCPSVREQRPAA
ncbi:MAG: hypothetical protein KF787_05675 [Phycisphaeraceae bacterium]|nr:hypothetical protein [Phycisphaerae bacterium]MBX3392121.1 hypothetical protein [Phycisphaeraceae bacterium]